MGGQLLLHSAIYASSPHRLGVAVGYARLRSPDGQSVSTQKVARGGVKCGYTPTCFPRRFAGAEEKGPIHWLREGLARALF